MIAALQLRRDWIRITGNHDRICRAGCRAVSSAELSIGAIVFRHEPVAGLLEPARSPDISTPSPELRGAAAQSGGAVSSANGARCVLPAFGAFAGGLNLVDPSLRAAFPWPARRSSPM